MLKLVRYDAAVTAMPQCNDQSPNITANRTESSRSALFSNISRRNYSTKLSQAQVWIIPKQLQETESLQACKPWVNLCHGFGDHSYDVSLLSGVLSSPATIVDNNDNQSRSANSSKPSQGEKPATINKFNNTTVHINTSHMCASTI